MNTGDGERTTGRTLSGDTIPPEEDPTHDPQEQPEGWGESSIYPMELEVGFSAEVANSHRDPVRQSVFIRYPPGTDSLPDGRFEDVRESIRARFEGMNPPVGVVGEVTLTEDDHYISLDLERGEDEKEPVPYPEWVVQNVYYLLSGVSQEEVAEADGLGQEQFKTMRELGKDMLPDRFVTIGGECRECGNQVREQRYLPPGSEEGMVMCDCGHGTSYPVLGESEEEQKDEAA